MSSSMRVVNGSVTPRAYAVPMAPPVPPALPALRVKPDYVARRGHPVLRVTEGSRARSVIQGLEGHKGWRDQEGPKDLGV